MKYYSPQGFYPHWVKYAELDISGNVWAIDRYGKATPWAGITKEDVTRFVNNGWWVRIGR